jgi:hypothetical protein
MTIDQERFNTGDTVNKQSDTDNTLKSLSETLLDTQGYPRQKFAGDNRQGENNEKKTRIAKKNLKNYSMKSTKEA